MTYKCTITPKILTLVSELTRQTSKFGQLSLPIPTPKLRRSTLAKSIFATAAIEGNTLNIDQVDAIIDGRPIVATHQREVLEIKNAVKAYSEAKKRSPFSVKDFLETHKLLMTDLVDHPGKFRSGQVGIWQNGKVRHVAPPAKRVPQLIQELFLQLQNDKDMPIFVKAAILHYEIEFIHPFSDGNGRMGRIWQHVTLLHESPIFEYCPFESVIFDRQKEYYKALRDADQMGESSHFVEFALDSLLSALNEVLGQVKFKKETAQDRIEKARQSFSKIMFTRKEYIHLFTSISTATASRDLAAAVKAGVLILSGDKALAKYRFVRRT